ncbi:MAG: TIM44-like domain-containing protein [Hydrogenovibrio sp.]|nr:TIM44-like domain-containing protein [Hydrogenovibrio sp.]
MKKLLVILLTLTSFMVFAQTAEAKRFGFGKSYGYSKQISPKPYNKKPSYQQPGKSGAAAGTATAGARSGASRWLGPLAGFAAGGLLAAMLFGDGFDGIQFFDIVVIALIAFMLMSLFRRRQSQSSYAAYQASDRDRASHMGSEAYYRESAPRQPENMTPAAGSIIGSGLSEDVVPMTDKPDWFDEQSFVDNAKQHFVAVQKAWDQQDMAEIHAYCTPELAQALQAELEQVDFSGNHTEVDELRAEIADMAVEGDYFIVSVRFAGFIIEEQGGFAHAFNEIWHIRRLVEGEGNWQIAGIQQNDAV